MSTYEDDLQRYKRLYEEEYRIVAKCWEALGISSYDGADGKSIYEHIAALKARVVPEGRHGWRDPKDKPPHLPGQHHSEDVLLCMKRRGYVDGDDHGIRLGHVSLGHWRPRGGNGNFDDDVLAWMPLPALPPQSDEAK